MQFAVAAGLCIRATGLGRASHQARVPQDHVRTRRAARRRVVRLEQYGATVEPCSRATRPGQEKRVRHAR